jgi:hypothetical protein
MKTRPKRPPSTRRFVITGSDLAQQAAAIKALGLAGGARGSIPCPPGVRPFLAGLRAAGLVSTSGDGRVKLTHRGKGWFGQLTKYPKVSLLVADPTRLGIRT